MLAVASCFVPLFQFVRLSDASRRFTDHVSQIAQRVIAHVPTPQSVAPFLHFGGRQQRLAEIPAEVDHLTESERLSRRDGEPRQVRIELLHTDSHQVQASSTFCPGACGIRIGKRFYPIIRLTHMKKNCIGISQAQLLRLQTDLSCPGYFPKTAQCIPIFESPACSPDQMTIEVHGKDEQWVLCRGQQNMCFTEQQVWLSHFRGLFFIAEGSRVPIDPRIELSVQVVDHNHVPPEVLLPPQLPSKCAFTVKGDCICLSSIPFTSPDVVIHLRLISQVGLCPLGDQSQLIDLMQQTREVIPDLQKRPPPLIFVAPRKGFWRAGELVPLSWNGWSCVLRVDTIMVAGTLSSEVICSQAPPIFEVPEMLQEEIQNNQASMQSLVPRLMDLRIVHDASDHVIVNRCYLQEGYLQIGNTCYRVKHNSTFPPNRIGVSSCQLRRLSTELDCQLSPPTEALCSPIDEVPRLMPRRITVEASGKSVLCFKTTEEAYRVLTSCLRRHVLAHPIAILPLNPKITLQVETEFDPPHTDGHFDFQLPEPPLELLMGISGTIIDLSSRYCTVSTGATVGLELRSQSGYCSLSSEADLRKLIQESRSIIPELSIPDRVTCYAPVEAFWVHGGMITISSKNGDGDDWVCTLAVTRISNNGSDYHWAICCEELAQLELPEELLRVLSEKNSYFS